MEEGSGAVRSWPFFLPLFTNVLEGVFPEVHLQESGCSRSYRPCGRPRGGYKPVRRGVARDYEHVYAPSCIVSSSCERTTGTIPSFRTSGLHWTGAMRPPAYSSSTTTCRP